MAHAETPDYTRPEVEAAADDLQLIHDLLGGTREIQASKAIGEYIVRWPDEREETYRKRTRAAVLYEGLGRTLSASVGMLFAVPPAITIPAEVERLTAHWANLDGAGTAGPVFVKRAAERSIAEGHGLILVDGPFQSTQGAPPTRLTERQQNLRPRWAYYGRAQILSWRTESIGNEDIVTQVVLHEPGTEPLGLYGIRPVHRYRVLSVIDGVAQFALWRKPDAPDEQWEIEAGGAFRNRRGETRATLPIAVPYAGRTDAPFVSRPPLLGVAFANLEHWRNKTELQWGTRIAAIEQPVITGELQKQEGQEVADGIKLGWEHYVHLQQGGTFTYAGPTGAGLGQLKTRVEEAGQEMAALGMSFLSRDTRAAETAEAKRLDATAENSTLATAAQGLEDAVNLALEHHAWYEGLEKAQAPTIAINRDFDQMAVDAARLSLIAPLIQSGMPIRKAVEFLRDGGFLKIADENEFEDIVMEWETGKVAEEEARALEAERRMNQPPLQEAT